MKMMRTDYPQSWNKRHALWDAYFDLHGSQTLTSSATPVQGSRVPQFHKICTRPGHVEEYTLSVEGKTTALPGSRSKDISTSLKVQSDHLTGVPVSVPKTLKKMVRYRPHIEPSVNPMDLLNAMNPFPYLQRMIMD